MPATTYGFAGTWGTQFAKPPKTESDLNTTYKVMMSNNQLNSEKNKIMNNSYCRFLMREGERAPVIRYRKSLEEEMKANDVLNAQSIIVSKPPGSSRALCRNKSNTTLRLIHSSQAPPAVGRSGMREKKERTKLAVPGERFSISDDPLKNSFVNRSWMYKDDPSHLYMRDGVPEAYMPTDASLQLGEGNKVEVGWKHGKSSIITYDPLSKSGSRRAGVFLDEY